MHPHVPLAPDCCRFPQYTSSGWLLEQLLPAGTSLARTATNGWLQARVVSQCWLDLGRNLPNGEWTPHGRRHARWCRLGIFCQTISLSRIWPVAHWSECWKIGASRFQVLPLLSEPSAAACDPFGFDRTCFGYSRAKHSVHQLGL